MWGYAVSLMRRILLVLLATALALPAGASAATVRAYSFGTRTLQVSEYNRTLHALSVPMRGLIATPKGTGPTGVVVIEHGSYPACRTPGGTIVSAPRFPCPAGLSTIDNAAGHTALVGALADAGFITLSIDANAAYPMDDGKRYPDGFAGSTTGAYDIRAQLFAQHLAAVGTASSGGANPFGVALAGRADMTRVGLIGHSRGGEGVVEAALRAHPGYTLRAMFLIAPTHFNAKTPPDVPMHIVFGSCDGDVWNLAGVGLYDRARGMTRTSPISQTLVRGANHNWFSSAWSPGTPVGFDDYPNTSQCAPRLVATGARPSAARQQRVAAALAIPFFRRHLLGGPPSSLIGDRGLARSVAGVSVVPSYDSSSARRVDIDRPAVRDRTSFGTRVRSSGVALGYRISTPPTIARQPPPSRWSPHRLAFRTIRWAKRGGRVVMPLPAPSTAGMNTLSMRLAVDTWSSQRTAKVDVFLRDRAGHGRTIRLTVTPERPSAGAYRKAVLGTFRISLSRFRGVNMSRLSVLELRPVGSRGALLLADLSFVRLS